MGQFSDLRSLRHTRIRHAYSTVKVQTLPPVSREMLFKDIYIITSCLIQESRVRVCSTPSRILELMLYHLQFISQQPLSGDCNLQRQRRCRSDRITWPLNMKCTGAKEQDPFSLKCHIRNVLFN